MLKRLPYPVFFHRVRHIICFLFYIFRCVSHSDSLFGQIQHLQIVGTVSYPDHILSGKSGRFQNRLYAFRLTDVKRRDLRRSAAAVRGAQLNNMKYIFPFSAEFFPELLLTKHNHLIGLIYFRHFIYQ